MGARLVGDLLERGPAVLLRAAQELGVLLVRVRVTVRVYSW